MSSETKTIERPLPEHLHALAEALGLATTVSVCGPVGMIYTPQKRESVATVRVVCRRGADVFEAAVAKLLEHAQETLTSKRVREKHSRTTAYELARDVRAIEAGFAVLDAARRAAAGGEGSAT